MKLQNEPFDKEERFLMEAVESGQSVQVSGDELTSISLAIHTPSAKTISLRVNEADLEGIKNRAAGAGIPYQTS